MKDYLKEFDERFGTREGDKYWFRVFANIKFFISNLIQEVRENEREELVGKLPEEKELTDENLIEWADSRETIPHGKSLGFNSCLKIITDLLTNK